MEITKPKSKQPIPENAKLVYQGKVFGVYQWEVKADDGSTKIFEKVKRPDTVEVLATTADNEVIVIKEEQPGRAASYGLPGGRVDEDEDILSSAKRELLEETGYESDDWKLLSAVQPVSKVEWAIYTFIAKDCKKVAEQNLDGTENIEVYLKSFEEFKEIILSKNSNDRELRDIMLDACSDINKLTEFKQKLFGK